MIKYHIFEYSTSKENKIEEIDEISLMFSLKINSLLDLKNTTIKAIEFENNGSRFLINVISYENIIISVNGCFTDIETMFVLLFDNFLKINRDLFKIISTYDYNLDIITNIDVSKIYFLDEAIEKIKKIGFICDDIEYPNDNLNRRKFLNIYGLIKNINPGKCHIEGGKIIKFLKIFCNHYTISNVDIGYSLFVGLKNKASFDKDLNMIITRKFMVSEKFNREIRSDKKILIVDVTIGDATETNLIDPHGNLLIIDNTNKIIERFEPNGPKPFDGRTDFGDLVIIVDFYLKQFFEEDEFYKDYQFISPFDYCPNIGPQIKIGDFTCESGGFCGTLSTIYGLLRIINPDYTREEIINVMFNYNSIDLRRFVSFMNMITSI